MRVLVVDDDAAAALVLKTRLESLGLSIGVAADGEQAIEEVRRRPPDLVISDILMPRCDGYAMARALKADPSSRPIPIIFYTASYTDAADEDLARRMGVAGFFRKPEDASALRRFVEEFAASRRVDVADTAATPIPEEAFLRLYNERLVHKLEERVFHLGKENRSMRRVLAQHRPPEIVAVSATMMRLLDQAHKVAATAVPVLICGETGTGKEMVAREVHRASDRAAGPFLAVNCSALPEPLLESELFGHERGAFTGASRTTDGLFHAADGGTLFLDEVGDMSPALQAKFLRVLEDGAVRRVGATDTQAVDARIVAATNRDLATDAHENRFRRDLFYRLAVVMLRTPPLRERREDIPVLVDHFLNVLRPAGRPPVRLAEEAMGVLTRYPWPGNVRELRNVIEHLIIFAETDVVHAENLPDVLVEGAGLPPGTPERIDVSGAPVPADLSLAEVERAHILRILRETGGERREAARLLGMSEATLYRRLRAFRLAE